jgi:gamma-glutamylaminecyclotransferase
MADKVKEIKEPVDKGMIRVLVYGTLKKGHSNYGLMKSANALFLGYDSVTGPYELFDLGAIPAVMDAENQGHRKIRGELYAIDPEGLASLDMMEGHPHLYQRRKLVTDVLHRRAWMYILVAPNFKHEGAESKAAGIWHGSTDEHKFWLTHNKKVKVEAKKSLVVVK